MMFFSKVKTKMKTETGPMKSLLRDFAKDERGISMIEFAFVAPLLITIWLGLIVAVDTEDVSTRVGKVSASVAEIISRSTNVNESQIDGAFEAGRTMLGTKLAQDMQIIVAGVEVFSDRSYNILWVRSKNLTSQQEQNVRTDLKIPEKLRDNPGFVVMSHTRVKHTPYGGLGGATERTYEYSSFFVPRVSIKTLCDDGCD